MPFPKTLILGQPFNNNFGGGITQANLFAGWDKDKLAVVCTDHIFNNINAEACETYYILGSEEYQWMFPFSLLQRKVVSGERKVKSEPGKKEQAPAAAGLSLRTRIIDNYFYPFLEYIGLFHRLSSIRLSDKFRKWIDAYNPDCIYAQASSREFVLFCKAVQEYTKKPMIYHVMDDWPSTISQKGPFKTYWHNRIDRELRAMMDRASVLMSISHAMAREYKNRYGKEFITFHNPIEIDFWKSHQRSNYELGGNPSILYAGRIGTGIQDSLESLAQAVDKVNNELKTSIQMVLQTKDRPEWIEKYRCAKHKPMVTYSELPKVFAEADFLYLPYDFSAESIRFIKYSMPTKAPEYMVSGTPVIVFGPAETALVEDAVQNKWAMTITENNTGKLADAVAALVKDSNLRRQIAATAIGIAEANYNSIKVRNRFREAIASLSGK
ncbi:MAG TPA: glycosyltransferase [Ferruginibacter sp.]|nr:group 1 glycosyl transferase [Chitinophagaceae bacterium]HRI24066.1 glycosyltransferase [Ferruginibacter sp.]